MKKQILFTAIAIIGLATATMAQVPSYVPSNGLKGWYAFDGNANDLSSNGNNGVVNGATLTADRFGNANSAYSFNGTSDFISVSAVPFLNVPFTISAWVKLNSLANFEPIIGFGELGAGTLRRMFFCPGFNSIGTPGIGNSGANDIITTSNVVVSGTWVNVAVCVSSYDISGVTFYINGVAYTNNNIGGATTPFPLNNAGFAIGKHTGNNQVLADFFTGLIDDIGIWNRVLTPQEMTELFLACTGGTIITQPTNQNVNIGNNAQFIIASSNFSDTYTWQTNLGLGWQDLSNAGQYSGASNDTLFVNSPTLTNNNQQFRCIVSAGSCKDTSDVGILTVVNTSINNNSNNYEFLVYPNPAKNQINVKIATNYIGSEFAITDQLGRKVLTGKLNSETSIIELGNLDNGVYLFRVGEKTQQTFKVVKE